MPSDPALLPDGPRRAALSQDRSRDTRRRLIRAAIDLWSERGFERGVEETTVEEIAREAGVTKGTFYFHFAHKEDILLEMGWGTADFLYEEAVHGAGARRPGLALLRQLLVSLSRRVESVPRPAVARSVAEFYGPDSPRLKPRPGHRDLHHAFVVALERAVEDGELDEETDVEELGRMMMALAMDAVVGWASGNRRRLRDVLIERADTVLAGAPAARKGRRRAQSAPRPAAGRGRRTAPK